jgi:hypothetical protein
VSQLKCAVCRNSVPQTSGGSLLNDPGLERDLGFETERQPDQHALCVRMTLCHCAAGPTPHLHLGEPAARVPCPIQPRTDPASSPASHTPAPPPT